MDKVIELANEIRAGVEDAVVRAQQRIVELETDCAYYKSEAERHNASANDLAQRLAHWVEKFDKEAIARADLEADLVKHRELLVHHLSVIDPLRAMVADLQGACELHREEVTELQERRDQYRTERDALREENAWLGKRHAALLESHAHLEAENAKLREVFETLLSNIDHATSCGAWNVQVGSQTHEIIEAARAALGEK